jgi:hypothetical protein
MSDNPKYIGKIDRIRVSMSEHYEVDYYVGQYLKTRGHADTDANRKALHDLMNKYPHSGTIMRDDLNTWLDARYKK